MSNHTVQRLGRIDIDSNAVLVHIAVDRHPFQSKSGLLQLGVVCKIKRNAFICGDPCDQIHKLVRPVGVVEDSAVNGSLDGLSGFFVVLGNICLKRLASPRALVIALRKTAILYPAEHFLA